MLDYMLNIGSKAPDFSALDQNGKKHRLADYQGRYLLLYFYPKDDTPGCTKEACAFRDSYQDLHKVRTEVLGVSKDSVESHGKFARKFGLPFPILSDSSREIISAYGVTGRQSFLISPAGTIVKIYNKVKPAGHAMEVIADLEGLG